MCSILLLFGCTENPVRSPPHVFPLHGEYIGRYIIGNTTQIYIYSFARTTYTANYYERDEKVHDEIGDYHWQLLAEDEESNAYRVIFDCPKRWYEVRIVTYNGTGFFTMTNVLFKPYQGESDEGE